MNLARAVQVSIDTAVQPCKDQKVSRVRGMHPSVGDWGGCSMLLAGRSWVVVHILCDEPLLFMNGLGGHSSSFGGFEGVDMECNHTLLKMRILAFLPINPCSST